MRSPMPDFTIRGTLVPGKRLGTELSFPTANLVCERQPGMPGDGVYIAEATIDGRRYVGVLNQGKHPTAPEGAPTIETHLIGYTGGDLYGHEITLTYRRFLRPEKRFDSLDELRAQLAEDVRAAADWATHEGGSHESD